MAVWSTLSLRELDLGDRIDAEYFQPWFLEVAIALEGVGVPLKELARLTTSAFYPPAVHLYGESGVPFIRGVDVIRYPVISEDQPLKRLPAEFVDTYGNIRTINREDIVVSKVGTPCFAGIVFDLEAVALSRTVLGITNLDRTRVDPYYLTAFLRSKYGFYQLLREREQQIQLQLTLERVGKINVFLPSLEVQREIGQHLHLYREELVAAQDQLVKATQALISGIGLSAPSLTDEVTYSAPFAEVKSAMRFDAEYFQPRFLSATEELERLGADSIANLEDLMTLVTNGQTPLRHDLTSGEVLFLTAEHIGDFRLDWSTEKRVLLSQHSAKLRRTQLHAGDVLVTIKGRVGNAAVVDAPPSPANINQDVALLRARPGVHPYYIAGYLNSSLGKAFVEQASTGQINPFLGLGKLRKIPVPVFSSSRMHELGEIVREAVEGAVALEASAEGRLREATSRVEALVEMA